MNTPSQSVLQAGVIGLAGFVGAIARYAVSGAVAAVAGRAFPYGTLVVNLTGAFLLALVLTLLRDRALADVYRLAITVGFIGAYTTFSTYVFEIYELARTGFVARAIGYGAISVALGVAAVVVGVAAGHWLER